MYTSRCSSESVVPSYFSIFKFFQLEGRVASMMLGMKRFLNCDNFLPKVLKDEGIMSKHTLRLMALGKPTVVDSASRPSDGLALGCRDLCAS